jgi:hypothetical protein
VLPESSRFVPETHSKFFRNTPIDFIGDCTCNSAFRGVQSWLFGAAILRVYFSGMIVGENTRDAGSNVYIVKEKN